MGLEETRCKTRVRMIDRRVALFTLGFAMLWPFLRRSFYGVTFAGFSDPQACYLIFLATASLVSIAAFALRKHVTSLLNGKPLAFVLAHIAASLLMTLCSLLAFQPIAGIVAAALLGSAFPILVVMWGQASLSLAAKKRLPALCAVVLSFVLGFAVSTLTVPLEGDAAFLFDCFPALSSLCWLACHRKGQLPGCRMDKTRQLPLARILVLGLFLLLISLLRGPFYTGSIDYTPGWDVVAPNMLSILMAAVTLGFLAFNKSTRQAFRYAITTFALVLLAGLLLAIYGDVASASLRLIIVGKSCFELFLWLLLVDSARDARIAATAIFVPFFLLFELLSSALSYLVSPLLMELLGIPSASVIPLFALVTALVFVAGCFLYLNFESKASPAPQPADASEDVEEGALALRLESLGGYEDLTPREQEIALLLAQGNSYKRVADMLFVSPSTVQTHAKSIYRKLSIHTKQELVDHVRASKARSTR